MESEPHYVYIMAIPDGSYYIGITKHLGNRLKRHRDRLGSRYTYFRGVLDIVYTEFFQTRTLARIREKQLKGWTRRKKEMLVFGHWGRPFDCRSGQG